MKRYIVILLLVLASALTCNRLSIHAAMGLDEEKKQADNKEQTDNKEIVNPDHRKSFEQTDKDAKKGDRGAQASLGYCYQYGYGVDKDEKKAIYWFEQAAGQGDAVAQYALGKRYIYGEGVTKDEKKGFDLLKRAAEQKNALAEYTLGCCYKNEIGVNKNEEEAFVWFKKAAEQGHAAAQNNLAHCFDQGLGVDKDEKQAFTWFKKAADKGNITAQYNLAFCYLDEKGVKRDVHEAQRWFEAANNNPTLGKSALSLHQKRLIAQLANLPECPICLGSMTFDEGGHPENDLSYVECCYRVFHTQCIEQWLYPKAKQRKWYQFFQRGAPQKIIRRCPFCRTLNPVTQTLQGNK